MHISIRIPLSYLVSVSYSPKTTMDSTGSLNVINTSNPDLGVNEQAEQVLNTILPGGKSESLISITAKGTEPARFQ